MTPSHGHSVKNINSNFRHSSSKKKVISRVSDAGNSRGISERQIQAKSGLTHQNDLKVKSKSPIVTKETENRQSIHARDPSQNSDDLIQIQNSANPQNQDPSKDANQIETFHSNVREQTDGVSLPRINGSSSYLKTEGVIPTGSQSNDLLRRSRNTKLNQTATEDNDQSRNLVQRLPLTSSYASLGGHAMKLPTSALRPTKQSLEMNRSQENIFPSAPLGLAASNSMQQIQLLNLTGEGDAFAGKSVSNKKKARRISQVKFAEDELYIGEQQKSGPKTFIGFLPASQQTQSALKHGQTSLPTKNTIHIRTKRTNGAVKDRKISRADQSFENFWK